MLWSGEWAKPSSEKTIRNVLNANSSGSGSSSQLIHGVREIFVRAQSASEREGKKLTEQNGKIRWTLCERTTDRPTDWRVCDHKIGSRRFSVKRFTRTARSVLPIFSRSISQCDWREQFEIVWLHSIGNAFTTLPVWSEVKVLFLSILLVSRKRRRQKTKITIRTSKDSMWYKIFNVKERNVTTYDKTETKLKSHSKKNEENLIGLSVGHIWMNPSWLILRCESPA